eukprot:TRINITY_DN1449_c0_g1_i1.p1 TRINITY_DN1449_c0_g1~~TRINITY_DN1449_c0_g1_i1.p1  ORF type:complete len:271 (+),score=32.49 TRINITY_DN1449_c0_g1_i1:31-843(+)
MWAQLALVFFQLLHYESLACQLDVCKSRSNCQVPNTENTDLFVEVCLRDGTQKAGTGLYSTETLKEDTGRFRCACCGAVLFSTDHMYDSGSGWPSFSQPENETAVTQVEDNNCTWCGRRTAIECSRCGIHLGHVFDDGEPPTKKRFSLNSVCLNFEPNTTKAPDDNLKFLSGWWLDMGISIGAGFSIIVAIITIFQIKFWFQSRILSLNYFKGGQIIEGEVMTDGEQMMMFQEIGTTRRNKRKRKGEGVRQRLGKSDESDGKDTVTISLH